MLYSATAAYRGCKGVMLIWLALHPDDNSYICFVA